jgi:outer membrane protein TolC
LPLAELPPQTLRRRPDLQAAYVAIKAAGLRTAVAYKEMLPSISLQAALEDMADSPGKALLDDPVWSLLSQLTAPLFKGGQLKAAADVAELQTAQAYQAYRKTLITAVHEVQQALDQEQSLAKRQAHIKTALNSARNNLKQYQRSYRTGLVSILDLLQVQRQTYDLEAQWDTLRYQRLANRINLGLALGLGARP